MPPKVDHSLIVIKFYTLVEGRRFGKMTTKNFRIFLNFSSNCFEYQISNRLIKGLENQYECICGNKRQRNKISGWSNLLSHISSEYKADYDRFLTNLASDQSTLQNFFDC